MDKVRIEYEFDTERFLMDAKMVTCNRMGETPCPHFEKITLRQVEAQSGVSASTLSRIGNGNPPDMKNFIHICSVLELEPKDYFRKVTWRREA